MKDLDSLQDLRRCELCEHRCGVNRLQGETGICRMTAPVVASSHLHTASPASYTVFTAGCNFKCLHCQSWDVSQYPDSGYGQEGCEDPETMARQCLAELDSFAARLIGAERMSFSGGEPTIHLPYAEKIVEKARDIRPDTQVNFDTNGYMTEKTLERILSFTTSITYDLKAYHEEVHLALTGASSKPVLRNAEYLGRYARDRLWEFRIVVIPEITEDEVQPLSEFIAHIDPSLPVCLLCFRPNFVLEDHPGSKKRLIQRCVKTATDSGLKRVYWSGRPNIPGRTGRSNPGMEDLTDLYELPGARLAGSLAFSAGCRTQPRGCASCGSDQECPVKRYKPGRAT